VSDCELYLGDCLDYLPKFKTNSVDLVFNDPPYPDLKGGSSHLNGGVAKAINDKKTIGNLWNANQDWVQDACRVARLGVICFCSYHSVSLFYQAFVSCGLEPRGLGTWYKRNSPNPVNNVPKFTTEFYWMFQKSPGLQWRNIETMIDEPMPVAGCFATERLLASGSKQALHPTQKPIKLIQEILRIGGNSVLDCFMGTGTTGVGAVQNKQSFIGIERDEHFFTIATKRIIDARRTAAGQPKQLIGHASDLADLPLFMSEPT
jgi:site-specific DNA-methyltransferase (adenine-specific)